MRGGKIGTFLIMSFFIGGLIFDPGSSRANEKEDQLKAEITYLKQKVAQLEQQIAVKDNESKSSQVWDPMLEMRQLQQDINRLFQDSFGRGMVVPNSPWFRRPFFDPQADFRKTEKQYILKMDVPGMDKDKINVEVKDQALVISGERGSLLEERSPGQYSRQERSFGSFLRLVPLPDDALTDHIEAQYKDGVLEVKINRKEAAGTKTPVKRKVSVN